MVLALFPAGFEDPFFTELERAVQQAYQPLCTTARKAKRAHQNQAQQQSVAWPAVDIHESASQFSIVAGTRSSTQHTPSASQERAPAYPLGTPVQPWQSAVRQGHSAPWFHLSTHALA